MFGVFNQLFGEGAAAPELKSKLEEGALLLDVRTPGEFRRGAAEGAENIPLQELQRHLSQLKQAGKPVIAYCRSGNRSGMAAKLLNDNGIEAYNAGSLDQARRLLAS